ncbi:chromate efflux transporter [Allorhizocola rhizosphaerae]|uniref:chromate efflux transporter n=1 Tax=Allorhizocola rhizosphaerae TaxID=1872709 RepID=UPI001FE8AD11|nr:chromate efflux transporter [Allorhizocola rhizosphaerae]
MSDIPFREAVRTWFLISLQTFGGPAGQIAVMQHILVDTKRWIDQKRFLHALNYCMLLPGPEAQQLAIYIGWLLHGTRGGLVAGILFVIPGVVALLGLSVVYVLYGDTAMVTALFAGLAPAVLAIVAHAVWRVGRRSLKQPAQIAIASAAFVCLAFLGVPFPAVIAVAALAGWVFLRRHTSIPEDEDVAPPPPRWSRSAAIVVIGLALWAAPVLAVVLFTGWGSTLSQQGLFFSGTALVTFGGAYAVLAYVAQRAVETYAWVTPDEMVRGLGLAETTPGPLIMVVQFVAFLGAYRDPGGLDPWAAAVIGSLLTTWVTFVPCFMFIFLGAPYVERLRRNRSLSAALTGITAAVVGVIANLAVYFAAHTLFADGSVRWFSVGIAVLAAIMLFALRWGVLRTLGVCALVGVLPTIVAHLWG